MRDKLEAYEARLIRSYRELPDDTTEAEADALLEEITTIQAFLMGLPCSVREGGKG